MSERTPENDGGDTAASAAAQATSEPARAHKIRVDVSANYVGEDGQKHRPVMLHRAILGSFERFIGILIEQYAGKFPLWLAPVQGVIATITSDADDFAREAADAMKRAGLRIELDLRNEKIGYKVREHTLAKVPLLFAVGRREA